VGYATQLFRLFSRPAAAMSDILDRGSLLFASSTVVIVSLLLEFILRGAVSFSLAFVPLIALAVIYVPATLLLTNLLGRLGGLSVVFQRDYSALLSCAAMAWTAVSLPIAVAAWLLPSTLIGAVAILAYVYFFVLMFFAVRTVFGTESRIAAGVAGISWIPLLATPFLWGPISFLLRWLTSPFLLFFVFYYLRGEFANLGAGMRSRQRLHRMLEAAAVNPHDGDAQYQLGLIYQQRRQYTEAIQRFKNAVAIDPEATDAHFQLGRMALKQGRLNDALEHLRTVFEQDEKHSSSEILRELGALYVAARQYQDAIAKLEVYIEQRPYDPEGLYYYGFALEQSGDVNRARVMYERAIEASRTTPAFRRRYTAEWSRRAQKQLRRLGRA
jgi:tetratricopeptide (TPR) repeat protein